MASLLPHFGVNMTIGGRILGGRVRSAVSAGVLLLISAVAPLDAPSRADQAALGARPVHKVGLADTARRLRPAAALAARQRAERIKPPVGRTLARLRARWPVSGPINSGFGARRTSWWRHRAHTGVDIGAPRGTPVRTPATGRVAFTGWRGGYGKTIVIDHGNRVHTLYAHLSRYRVRRGQLVQRGSTIGTTGSTGHASGPHLHYEILVNDRPLNPRPYLGRPPRIR
jgi:murein DD-endopeptidase MepM/ murein hydrolase activator NlpD